MPSPLHIESNIPDFRLRQRRWRRMYKNYASNRRLRFRSERSNDLENDEEKCNYICSNVTPTHDAHRR